MLDICKDHLEKGTGIETDADVMVTVSFLCVSNNVPNQTNTHYNPDILITR